MSKILLVEDDEALAMGIEYSLMDEGYEVKIVNRVKKSKEEIDINNYDLALLDINLPDGTGYEICKYIKENKDMPIIFLTALDDEVNVVLGLDIGADDYITKPFRIRELLSRIKAVLRRSNSGRKEKNRYVKTGDLIIDRLSASISKKGEEVLLTSQEYRLLLGFIKKPKEVLRKDELLEILFGDEYSYVEDNTLSVYIKRLREKIGDDSKNPTYIINKRGLGYQWVQSAEEE